MQCIIFSPLMHAIYYHPVTANLLEPLGPIIIYKKILCCSTGPHSTTSIQSVYGPHKVNFGPLSKTCWFVYPQATWLWSFMILIFHIQPHAELFIFPKFQLAFIKHLMISQSKQAMEFNNQYFQVTVSKLAPFLDCKRTVITGTARHTHQMGGHCFILQILAATSHRGILHVNLNHSANHPTTWHSSSDRQQIIVARYNKDPEHYGSKLISHIFCIASCTKHNKKV